MTMTEAAALYGVSRQTIYKRLSKEATQKRKPITAYRNQDTHTLTAEGERVLASTYTVNKATKSDNVSTGDVNQATEAERLTKEVERLTNEVDRLTKEVETLKADKASLYQALINEQHLHAMALKLLPASTGDASADAQGDGVRLTVWERITGKRKVKKQNDTSEPVKT